MSIFKPLPEELSTVELDGKIKVHLSNVGAAKFNPTVLGLGDLSKNATSTDAIAAVFDLEGFTNFCKQIEPHLSVPLFLSKFLEWIMSEIKTEMTEKTYPAGISLWSPLPYFIKYMGDGILVLWNCADTNSNARRNIIISLKNICEKYERTFLPNLKKLLVDPPNKLRCGIARGTVFTVGDGNDYVGTCINMASRLQKLNGLTFAFNIRGFDIHEEEAAKFYKTNVLIAEVAIRGIGDHELIGIIKGEHDKLNDGDRKLFKTQ